LEDIAAGLGEEIGPESIMMDAINKATASKNDFPIKTDEGRILSAHGQSSVMTSLPIATTGYLFVHPDKRKKACPWLKKNVHRFLKPRTESHD